MCTGWSPWLDDQMIIVILFNRRLMDNMVDSFIYILHTNKYKLNWFCYLTHRRSHLTIFTTSSIIEVSLKDRNHQELLILPSNHHWLLVIPLLLLPVLQLHPLLQLGNHNLSLIPTNIDPMCKEEEGVKANLLLVSRIWPLSTHMRIMMGEVSASTMIIIWQISTS